MGSAIDTLSEVGLVLLFSLAAGTRMVPGPAGSEVLEQGWTVGSGFIISSPGLLVVSGMASQQEHIWKVPEH